MKKIFGIRYFRIILFGDASIALGSLVSDYVWQSPIGWNENPPSPDFGDTGFAAYDGMAVDDAGFHAYRTIDFEQGDEVDYGSLLAVVRGFGPTEIHEKVFRSQTMQIEAIVSPSECSMASKKYCGGDVNFVAYPAEPLGYELIPACKDHSDMIYANAVESIWPASYVMSKLCSKYGVDLLDSPQDVPNYLTKYHAYTLGEK